MFPTVENVKKVVVESLFLLQQSPAKQRRDFFAFIAELAAEFGEISVYTTPCTGDDYVIFVGTKNRRMGSYTWTDRYIGGIRIVIDPDDWEVVVEKHVNRYINQYW